MSDSLIGRTLVGRYRIDEAVSEELLGRVYRCVDTQENRPVMAKVLHAHLVQDATRFARFVREVRATSMVKHVNTIELLDSGSEDHVHFVIMEYFPSHTLEVEMEKGPIAVERVAHIASQIASAIGVAHQESITHRALSLRNVLLLENARSGDFVKVRDFGLSKLERFDDDAESSNLTEAGVRVGNTAYMAPEYIDRDRFHPKGDLYALGCMMFEMLTGRAPYTGRAADVLSAHVLGAVPSPSEHNAAVPPWMDEIVRKMLAKKPEERPGAYQVVRELEAGVGHKLDPPALADPEERISRPPAATDELTDEVPRKKLPIGAILGALTGLGLAAGFVLALGLAGAGMLYVLDEAKTISVIAAPSPGPRTIVVPPPVQPEPELGAPSPQPRSKPTVVPSGPNPSPEPAAVDDGPVRTRIKVSSNRRALVFINGSIKGYSPLEVKVPPGEHSVEAMMPGDNASRQTQKLRVRRGEAPSIVFTF